jgi:hypothetical protein
MQLATDVGLTGELDVEWPEGVAASIAGIRGMFAGARVVAQSPAP